MNEGVLLLQGNLGSSSLTHSLWNEFQSRIAVACFEINNNYWVDQLKQLA